MSRQQQQHQPQRLLSQPSSQNQLNSSNDILIRCKFKDRYRNIRVVPAAGYDSLLQKVASAWRISEPVELEYTDPANGEVCILGSDDDIVGVLSQNYQWEPLASPARSAYRSPCADSYSAKPKPEPCSDTAAHCYRQSTESQVARELFWQMDKILNNERAFYLGGIHPQESKYDGLHPFLDAFCLAAGEDWEQNFMSALYHSGVHILLCSEKAMEHMRKADETPDNVLLEWELALQMKEEHGCDVLPVFLSERAKVPFNGTNRPAIILFNKFDASDFPDRFHIHKMSPRRQTVRHTVAKVLALQGAVVDPKNDVDR
ncbi:hypothetical protein DFJ73DRAFT_906047 [Zopfochytrium polystomum]|nr:hypothetical protein DFJ73DRAFT_906047 [Zopfochytrium polystomum]